MGVLPIVLVILAMKIPIVGLWWLVLWLAKEPSAEAGPEEERAKDPQSPRSRPRPQQPRGPRRRGPHGGAAASPPPRSRQPGRERLSSTR